MSDKKEVGKYFCISCSQKTKHWIQSEYSRTDTDDEYGVSMTYDMLIAECCGCENLVFVKRTYFSEDIDHRYHPVTGKEEMRAIWQEAVYPPPTYRSAPKWFDDLPDETMRSISEEIYKSLQTESLYLAAFGSRTLMDRLIVLTVGDKGNFPKGLKALENRGMLSQHEIDILKPIIEAGHAAAHRGWAPNKEQISTILDTVEGLIHRLLVLPKLSEELEDAVPSRHGTAKKSNVPTNIKDKMASAPKALYDALESHLVSLGKDVIVHPQKHYFAYKRSRNFACVQVYNQKKVIRVYLNIDPDDVDTQDLFVISYGNS